MVLPFIWAQAVILTYSTGLSPWVVLDVRGSKTKIDLCYPGQDLRTPSKTFRDSFYARNLRGSKTIFNLCYLGEYLKKSSKTF